MERRDIVAVVQRARRAVAQVRRRAEVGAGGQEQADGVHVAAGGEAWSDGRISDWKMGAKGRAIMVYMPATARCLADAKIDADRPPFVLFRVSGDTLQHHRRTKDSAARFRDFPQNHLACHVASSA